MNMQMTCDLVEIQALISAYSYAIDAKQFDELDDVFTPDCEFEYVIEGGRSIRGDYQRIKPWLAKTLADFPVTAHLMGLPQIRVSGDQATAKTLLINPMQLSANHGSQLFFVGGTYADRLVRTSQGWRICERKETPSWVLNYPSGWEAPAIPD